MTTTEDHTPDSNGTDDYVGDDSPAFPATFMISLPVRLDYLSFLTELAGMNDFMVSVKDGFLIIKEVIQP